MTRAERAKLVADIASELREFARQMESGEKLLIPGPDALRNYAGMLEAQLIIQEQMEKK